VLNYLGYSWLVRGGDIEEATDMISRAVAARPNDPQIVDSMGWAFYLTGRYEDAAKFMEKAVNLLPGDPVVNDHLGDIYWRQGRRNEARFQWERSLSFFPDAPLEQAIRKKLAEGLPDDPGVAASPQRPVVAADDAAANAVP
jgi:Flp pilus assembly protein TadD